MAADRRRRFLTSVLASLALVAPFALVPALPASAVPVMAMSAADLVDYLGRVDDYEITVGAAITVNDNVITVRGDKVLDLNGFFVTTRSIVLDTEAELTISATTGSGTLTASSNLDDYAGINTSNGILNITGGNVVAGGGSDAAGIGGGAVESNGELNITGGTVIAQGGRRGAGIGGGWGGGGGIINLLGGFISGLGSDGAIPTEAGGAGIGGGNTGSGGTITITQALVEAHGAVGGAGIGGGYGRELGQLTVNSGTVIATAGDGASGIGGGGSNAAGIADAGTIQINGGVVTSTGNWSFGGVNGRGIASLSIAAGAQVNAHGKFGTSLTGSIGTISIAGTLTVYNDFSVPTGSLVTIGEGGTLNGAIPLVGGGTINNHGVITNSTVASTLTITDHNYLVTFNPAPVTPTISVRVYAPTFSLGLKSFPGDPVRAGFTFDGWLDGTSPFTSTTELAGDTAVTADWVSHYALSPLATSTVAGAPVTYTVLDVTTTPATDVTGQFTFSDDTVTPYPGA
ncbi:MAG TPA: hypothetical protein PK890_07055, partial [Terrimesophilobacter sp.]|nr:hypothetical protein [Terrimesophilobacter sp.]